jgi:hypothetical protein
MSINLQRDTQLTRYHASLSRPTGPLQYYDTTNVY